MAKSKPKSPLRKRKGPAGRKAALIEQSSWINDLIMRGWTYASLDRELDVRSDTISRWHNQKSVARGVGREKLAALHRLRKRPSAQGEVHGLIGPISAAERAARDAKAKRYGLHEPEKRAATIKKLAKRCGLTLPQMARFLNIGYKTIHKYADPTHKRAIAPVVLDALVNMILTQRNGATLSHEGQFHNLARRLYGKYYDSGFEPGSDERLRVFDILLVYTGLSRRALYAYIPARGGFGKQKLRPSKAFIRKLEELVNLLEPNKNLLNTKRVLVPRGGNQSPQKPIKKHSKKVA